jgi:energy-coupling factor transporter ATP-binding protein EcfA2
MNIREGIQKLIEASVADSPWLAPRWYPDLETQVMVFPGPSEVAGVYSDGAESWANTRWPNKAGTAPEYRDRKITYSPAKRVARVGSTWWDWVAKESVAIGFDIDVVDSGHADSTNQVDEFKLGQIVAQLSNLDYVTLVRSTGGKGVHGYVFFDKADRPKTENHNEHTQVALAVLKKINDDIGLDLIGEKIVDVKGVILWFWASTSPADHPGFGLIKEASRELTNAEIPEWDKVVAPTPSVINGKTEYQKCELEEEHIRVLGLLEDLPYAYRWVPQHSMAQTHTAALKILHSKGGIKGIFETNSKGSDPGNPNCYITPRKGGGFKVTRYGNGQQEHPSWKAHEGSTWTFYNQDPDWMSVVENYSTTSDMGSATINAESLREVLALSGITNFNVPEKQIKLLYDASTGKITASCQWSAEEPAPAGWTKNGKKITAILPLGSNQELRTATYLEQIDEFFRFVVQPNLSPMGWYHKTGIGWIVYPSASNLCKVIIQTFGKQSMDEVFAIIQNNPWKLENEPFQPEELPNRRWNINAATFVCPPAEKPGPHQHFDMILDHLGSGLDEAVRSASWSSAWGINSGADYLRFWIAAAVKYPFQPLPYLFFFGQQGCGKSIFFETLNMLFPNAVHNVASAMTNENGFNGEMKPAVFAYIDEKDLNEGGKGAKAYQRIKEWTLARELMIHQKGCTPYLQRNTLKFIQCSNSINSIRIDRDDSRIVAIDVPKLNNPIPKSIMEKALREEAPNILRTLLTTEIPPAIDRTTIPHINTEAKLEIGEASMSEVQKFVTKNMKPCPGNLIPFNDFRDRLNKHLDTIRSPAMGPNAISSELRKMEDMLVVGKVGKNNVTHLGNVVFNDQTGTLGKKLILNNGRLT